METDDPDPNWPPPTYPKADTTGLIDATKPLPSTLKPPAKPALKVKAVPAVSSLADLQRAVTLALMAEPNRPMTRDKAVAVAVAALAYRYGK